MTIAGVKFNSIGFDSAGDKHFVLILHICETTLQCINEEIVVSANLHLVITHMQQLFI